MRGGYCSGAEAVAPPDELAAPLSRQAFLNLCEARRRAGPLVADLFCGAGGFSLGLEAAGFQVVLGVDNQPDALRTHELLFNGLSLGRDLACRDSIDEIAELLRAARIDVIVGGPPCQPFSKAGRALLRDLVRTGRRSEHDERRDLWQSFLAVVIRSRPAAVMLENVPDMALDPEMLILRSMVDELEKLDYRVETRTLDSCDYGVPQFRQRFFLVALPDDCSFEWPEPNEGQVTVGGAIGDLPEVTGGWTEKGAPEWLPYGGPKVPFQVAMREGLTADCADRVYDHHTRPVREDDLRAFALMDSSTKYKDLPSEVKRYRDDIFDDKYKRPDLDGLSRTITAHLAKDGYWYIHPTQDRTITVREAARLQTFPDRVRFAGSPTQAFRQIGNAVPPALAERLGRQLRSALETLPVEPENQRPTTRALSRALSDWIAEQIDDGGKSLSPWYLPALGDLRQGETPAAKSRWLALLGELIHRGRANLDDRLRRAWHSLGSSFAEPAMVDQRLPVFRAIAHGLGLRASRIDQVVEAARQVAQEPAAIRDAEVLAQLPGIPRTLAHLTFSIAPTDSFDPVAASQPAARVTSRFNGTDRDPASERTTHVRMAVARMAGVDDDDAEDRRLSKRGTLARIALIELGRGVCTSGQPRCSRCPLRAWCLYDDRWPQRELAT